MHLLNSDDKIGSIIGRGHFEAERVGTAFPLLNSQCLRTHTN